MLMTHKIRLALIRQKYTPFGGAERFVDSTIEMLSKHQPVETTLITRNWPTSAETNKVIKICNPRFFTRILRDWTFSRCACQETKKGGFDLIQSNERVPCGDIYRAGDGVHREWLEKWAQVLPLWKKTWLKISPFHLYLKFIERKVFCNPNLKIIITNSLKTKEEIEKYFPDIHAEIHVIRNGVDTERFNPLLSTQFRSKIREQIGIKKDAKVLLFVGSGFKRKGVPLLLSLIEQLPKHHLIVIGKDSKLKKYQAKAKRLGINDKCHFLGPQDDTRWWYGAADIFVFPTLYDPLPNAVLEAMASGLPVLIGKDSGAAELIKNGVNGYALPPTDLDAWVSAVKQLGTKEKINEVGLTARSSIKHLTPQSVSNELMKIYQELLS